MGVKAKEYGGWIVVIRCHLHVNKEFRVFVFDDILVFLAGFFRLGAGQSWEFEDVVVFDFIDQVFDNVFCPDVLEVEITLAIGVDAIAIVF